MSRFPDRERIIGYLTILPTTVLFALAVAIPILWAIVASFFNVPVLGRTWTWVGLKNYVVLITSGDLQSAILISTVYAISTTIATVVIGVWIAMVMSTDVKGVAFIRSIVIAPYLLPTIAVGTTFIFIGSRFGIANDPFLALGIIERPISTWTTMPFAIIGLIVVSLWQYSLFAALLVLSRLQAIPDSHYEAANLAGANAWARFRDITLPHLRGILLIIILLRGVFMFTKFDIIWILTQGGPANATRVLSVLGYKIAFTQYLLGRASAVSTIGFGILFVAAIIYFGKFKPTAGLED